MDEEHVREEDELDAIFVDKNIPVDRKLLAEILKPFVTIDVEGIIDFKENYQNLKGNLKVLIYLCCKKAMVSKEIPNIKESCGPLEISKKIGVSQSNAKHALYRDFNKILKKEKEGFIISNYNLRKVKDIILGENID